MAGEWTQFRLGDVCTKIGSGATPRGGSGVYLEQGDFALIRSQNIYNDGFHHDGLAYLTRQHATELSNVEVRKDDVLLNITGDSVARSCQVDPEILPARVNQHVAIIRPDPKKLAPRFLRYYLVSPAMQSRMLSLAGAGATRNALTKGMIEGFEVPAPADVAEQQAIACVLGALDDKIELNRRRNGTLEAVARAIFQSWFVDFDPVRAKAAGRAPAGMSKEIAALFPAAFEDSALGPIPKGWRVTTLAEQITASKGVSYKGDFLCEPGEGLPMHNLNSIYEGGGYKHEGLKWYKGEYQPRHLLKPGDVIVTNTEQGFEHLLIGYSAIVPERYGDRGLFSHHIYRIQPKATSYLPAWFAYLMLRTRRFHEIVAGHSNGTTVNMLPLDGLQKPRFILPPEALVKRFGEWFVPTHKQLEVLHDENVTLAALRDALLPKLISGELRVPDAERIVGRANA